MNCDSPAPPGEEEIMRPGGGHCPLRERGQQGEGEYLCQPFEEGGEEREREGGRVVCRDYNCSDVLAKPSV